MPACCWIITAAASALIRPVAARTVRHVDQIDAVDPELTRLLDQRSAR